jgi:polar amino acid transport system substrate-binding protein
MLARLILATALLCGAAQAGATEPECGTLRVGFYEDGALYYHGADGHWTGIDKDVVDELARRLGCGIVAVSDSRVRIWAALAGGRLDMSVSTMVTPERERLGRFIPYLAGRNYVMLHSNLAGSVHSMADFLAVPDYKLAVVKSYQYGKAYGDWLGQLRAQGRVFEVADYPAMLRLLKLGRVQAFIVASSSLAPLTREQAAGTMRIMDWTPKDAFVGGLYLSRQRVDEPLAARFSQAMRAMREDGTLRRIYERHVGAEFAGLLLNY